MGDRLNRRISRLEKRGEDEKPVVTRDLGEIFSRAFPWPGGGKRPAKPPLTEEEEKYRRKWIDELFRDIEKYNSRKG